MKCTYTYQGREYTEEEIIGILNDVPIEEIEPLMVENTLIDEPKQNDNISYQFKTVNNIANNLAKVNAWYKSLGDTDSFWNKLQQDLQIPRPQVVLLRNSEGDTIGEKVANFAADFNFTTRIDIATERKYETFGPDDSEYREYKSESTGKIYHYDDQLGWLDNNGNEINALPDDANEILPEATPTKHYSNLTVPGGTNYQDNEISTPAITPAIRGHAVFATNQGIGWFRTDEKAGEKIGENIYNYQVTLNGILQTSTKTEQEAKDFVSRHSKNWKNNIDQYTVEPLKKVEEFKDIKSKTRRVLEVQSDLFQKGRDRERLNKIEGEEWGNGKIFTSENGKNYIVIGINKTGEKYGELNYRIYDADIYKTSTE